MRKFLTGMFAMLFVIAVVVAGVFGYLYFSGQNAVDTAKQDKLNTELLLTASQQKLNDAIKPRVFNDAKLGFTVTYPFDWTLTMNTDITSKFAQEGDVSGPILGAYGATLAKGDAVLTINKILGGIGGRESYVDPATYDYKLIASNKAELVRFSLKGKNEWFYVPKVSCADVEEAAGKADAICGGLVFGKTDNSNYPASVKLKASAEADIADADAIVLSVQK